MSEQTTRTDRAGRRDASCAPATRVTKSLLGYGVIAGPFYVVVGLCQALTRDGFDLTRHSWSLLSNGALGWIQITNFAVTGLLTGAFAVGLRRVLRPGRGATWAPRLVGAYAVSLCGAAAFVADPALGFPAGTPDGVGEVSWHGILHLVCGAVGFLCLIAACFVVGQRFAVEGRGGWAWFSRITGVVFFAGFAGIASGSGAPAFTLGFVAAVLLAWSWISAVSLHLYRRATGLPTN
ncbi:MAG: DUF998 domain-containing protein [Actinopolymorphaceae bacterium]